ncbi:MAG: hypothetical protein A2496_04480 [Burkholderiales bacterium RIFOXYC12_FULL_60_6]|nr:MAG: hypothetical protein A2496_04480 [Burkholderiales bacterium RIFOXYC12_FULL_60_6]
MDELFRWWPLIIFLSQGLLAWFVWSLKQQFISRADCKDCKKDRSAADHEASDRIEDVEDDVGKLATRDEMAALGNKIERLSEKIGNLDGRLSGINRAVDLLNQHHLKVNG